MIELTHSTGHDILTILIEFRGFKKDSILPNKEMINKATDAIEVIIAKL